MTQKLSDLQRVLLSNACQRDDGSLFPLPASIDQDALRARKAVTALIKRSLAVEVETRDPDQSWREDDDRHIGVAITDAGRALMLPEEQHEPDAAPGDVADLGSPEDTAESETGSSGEPALEPILPSADGSPGQPASPPAAAPRADTKKARVLAMLGSDTGASLDELVAAIGWLPHTTRAALTGLRKAGHAVLTEKVDGKTRYRIAGAA